MCYVNTQVSPLPVSFCHDGRALDISQPMWEARCPGTGVATPAVDGSTAYSVGMEAIIQDVYDTPEESPKWHGAKVTNVHSKHIIFKFNLWPEDKHDISYNRANKIISTGERHSYPLIGHVRVLVQDPADSAARTSESESEVESHSDSAPGTPFERVQQLYIMS